MNNTAVEADHKTPNMQNPAEPCVSCSAGEKKGGRRAFCLTAEALVQAGKDALADEMIINRNLIYSSPATLAFNSPGAQGFGVSGPVLPSRVR